MTIKTFALNGFALVVLGTLLTVGCSQQSDKPLIGVVSKGQAHKFWQSIHAGVVAAGEEFDVEILWNGPAQDTDYSRQIQIVDSMVARGVDGLAIAPVERTALVLPIERAVKAGIPVTIYDSGLDSDVYMTYVATNNYQGGEMAGRKLAELIGGKGEVVMVMHMPGSASSMDREKAFADVIEKEFPEIKIVWKTVRDGRSSESAGGRGEPPNSQSQRGWSIRLGRGKRGRRLAGA